MFEKIFTPIYFENSTKKSKATKTFQKSSCFKTWIIFCLKPRLKFDQKFDAMENFCFQFLQHVPVAPTIFSDNHHILLRYNRLKDFAQAQ